MILDGLPRARYLENWEPTSDPDAAYNCLAHAIYDNRNWIWPDEEGQWSWPPALPRGETVEVAKAFLKLAGYSECPSAGSAATYFRIAVYGYPNGELAHFARQEADGRWYSKLGRALDIRHLTPADVGGGKYGEAVCFMCRSRAAGRPMLPQLHPPAPSLISPDGMPLVRRS
ncbi:MAG: DUF7689 domain-containing protein [Devosia sp.]